MSQSTEVSLAFISLWKRLKWRAYGDAGIWWKTPQFTLIDCGAASSSGNCKRFQRWSLFDGQTLIEAPPENC